MTDGRRRLLSAAASLAMPFAAALLQWLCWPLIRPFAWFLFYPAAFASSWLGGWKLGLVSTFASAMLVAYFFIPPYGSAALEDSRYLVSIGGFILMGALFAWTHKRLADANRRAQESAKIAEDLNRNLESRVRQSVSSLENTTQALRESELLYRLLAENSADVVWTLDPEDERFLYVSPSVKHMLQYEPSELLKLGVERVLSDVSLAYARQRLVERKALYLAGRFDSYTDELLQVRKDGSLVWTETTTRFARDGRSGRLVIYGSCRDIDDRKKALEELRFHENLLRETGRLAHVGGWEFDPATGKGTWTDEVARIHGLSPSEATSMSKGLSFYHGEARKRIEKALSEAVSEGKPYDLELDLVSADGISKRVRTIGHPTLLGGKVVRVRGAFMDITEIRRTQEQLVANEARLRLALEAAKAGTWEWNLQTGVQHWSNTLWLLYGLAPGAGVASHELWFRTVDPEDLEAVKAGIDSAVARGGEISLEWRTSSSGRARRWLMSRGQPMLGEKGELLRYFGIVVDITDRKLVEAKLKDVNAALERRVAERTAELTASNEELQSFSFSVSHDLRSPLRGIDGFARLLQERYASNLDEQGLEYLSRIVAAAGRMSQLIDDLIDLARIARLELNFRQVDLSALAGDIFEDLRRREPGRRAEIHIEPGLVARGDPHLLRALLENLFENSWKFTSRKDEARISFGKTTKQGAEPDRLVCFVRDNGAGFDMRYAHKLFGVFQRLHGMNEFPGSGVGLATVQRVVQRHRGEVWAESLPGEGATFYFSLPL